MTAKSTTCCSNCCLTYAKCVIVGLFAMIGVCIFGAIEGPSLVNDFVDQQVSLVFNKIFVLEPFTELYESWANPEMPVYQRFYFFDVQNADDVIKKGAKPRLLEIGPYTYRINVSRYNISFGDNDTLSFQQMSWLSFVPELSSGQETDSFTTLNLPLVISASALKYGNMMMRQAVSAMANIHDYQMFTTLTVGELLWGYDDPFMKQMQELAGEEMVPTYEIGILPNLNGSSTSAVINTGASNITLLNKLIEWEGKTKLDWWASEEANGLKGSDGSPFHPDITAEETIYIYDQAHCRSMPYIHSENVALHDIPMMHFHIPWYAYANASRYPSNAGFCLEDTCPDGILNVTACMGVHFGMSLPHFLYASADIRDYVDGLEPNETKHQSYFVVEPVTGVLYKQRQRVQMNLYMESIEGIVQTAGIRSMYVPVIWFETSVDVPESIARDFKKQMSATEGYDDIVLYSCIAIAAFCLVVVVLLAVCLIMKSRENTWDNEHEMVIKQTKELSGESNPVHNGVR